MQFDQICTQMYTTGTLLSDANEWLCLNATALVSFRDFKLHDFLQEVNIWRFLSIN